MGTFGFGRGAVQAIVPTPNGRAVAVAVDRYDGPVLTHPDCADIALITTADGRSAGGIFRPSLGERYTDPVWSPDGRRLYAIRSNSRPCTEVTVSPTRGSYECTAPLQSSTSSPGTSPPTGSSSSGVRARRACRRAGRSFPPDGRLLAVTFSMGRVDTGWRPSTRATDGASSRPNRRRAGRSSSVGSTTGSSRCSTMRASHTRSTSRPGAPNGSPAATASHPRMDAARPSSAPSRRRARGAARSMWMSRSSRPASARASSRPSHRPGVWRVSSGPRTHTGSPFWFVDPDTERHHLFIAPADGSAPPKLVTENADGPIDAWAWMPATP